MVVKPSFPQYLRISMVNKLRPLRFGGYDPAKRVDAAALQIVTLDKNILYHTGSKVWEGIDYKEQGDDILEIQHKELMNCIGVDRSGVGDAVMEVFPEYLQRILIPIVSTQQRKLEMIDLVQGLFNNDRLKLHPDHSHELRKQILEQERIKTDAGNVTYKHPQGRHDDQFWALAYACYIAASYINGMPRITVAVAETTRSRNMDAFRAVF